MQLAVFQAKRANDISSFDEGGVGISYIYCCEVVYGKFEN